jgi:excisionase family DNA binding protein
VPRTPSTRDAARSISSSVNAPVAGSVRHAAARLGVTPPTIYALIAAGKLRAYKIGRATRITDEAIADYIRAAEAACPLVRRNVDEVAA